MANFNRVILAGNLTRDPELRYTPKGTAVAKIGMALNRSWKTETGETREEVTFVDVEAYGRQAEVISQYVRKGRPLLVEGRLKLDQWEDKTTHQKVSKLKVVLEQFSFLDSGGGRSGESSPGGGESFRSRSTTPAAPSSDAPAPASAEASGSPEDDDVPF
ncbi:MAG: single-stranded DNA-binding protein [Verrucomicrobia bacterium]|nr:single-stranded DNA-binding protein [Verrucomicrobiota bacterium]